MNTAKLTSKLILRLQGIYFVLTGIWPLISMSTFLKIAGPKTDLWLVQVVGILILVIGTVLLITSYAKKRNPQIILLAAGSALAFIIIDTTYYLSGIISAIYLLDALIELVFLIFWLLESINTKRKGNIFN